MQTESESRTMFVGIDLAWQGERNPSGAAILRGDVNGVELHSVSPPLRSYAEIQSFLHSFESEPCVLAIDGPLIINNVSGIRQCERDVGRAYGARHASCHSSNLALYPNPLSVRLASDLIETGFRHVEGSDYGKVLLEVYPHAAFVALFDLPRIVRYKKGRAADRIAGLRIVQDLIRSLSLEAAPLRLTDTLLEFLNRDPAQLRGAARKDYEDSLDAVFCAYLAYFFWRYGVEQSEIFGTLDDGYIVNPKLRRGYQRPAAA